MTSKRFLHKRTQSKYSREKALQMNKVRWDTDRARRDAEEPARVREMMEIRAMNYPCNPGDVLGTLQWVDAYDGKVRRWVVRIGQRRDQITLEFPGQDRSRSTGWSSALVQIRKHIVNHGQ